MRGDAQRLPPFGKVLAAARRRGEAVNLAIYAGNRCWRMAQAREHSVALPDPESGRRTDWRQLVGGLPGVLLVARGWDAAEVDELARSLVLAGARLVTALTVLEGEPTRVARAFYRRGPAP